MTLTTPFTELEAVNELLASIGQAPVNALNTGISDVNIAQAELAKATRFVQLQGFAFNTDAGYTFQPNVTGDIALPPGMLKFDPTDKTRNITTRRNSVSGVMALWDADDLTFKFTEPFTATVVWGFSFEDLPETARAYIAVAAARKFQARFVGALELDRYNQQDENRAWLLLQRDERASRDTNMFRKSPSLQRGYNRSRWTPTP